VLSFGTSEALLSSVLGLGLLRLQCLDAACPLVLEQILDVGLHGDGHFPHAFEDFLLLIGLIGCFLLFFTYWNGVRLFNLHNRLLESNHQVLSAIKSQVKVPSISAFTISLLDLSVCSVDEHLINLRLEVTQEFLVEVGNLLLGLLFALSSHCLEVSLCRCGLRARSLGWRSQCRSWS